MISKDAVSSLPSVSGVYQFTQHDRPVYIGKSVNIKARVSSHIQAAKLSKKELLIVSNSNALVFQETISDFDAIVLEAKLIKEFRPIYNIALKDDKHFLYIKITVKDNFPKVFSVRAENDRKSLYFGPFASTETTEKLLYHLRTIIPFCTQKKIGKHACFYSKIGLCDPCPSYINNQTGDVKKKLQIEYQSHIKTLIVMLKGEGIKIIAELESELAKQITKGDYEKAIETRDKILSINRILYSRSFTTFDMVDYTKQSNIDSQLRDFLYSCFKKQINDNYRIECYDMSTLFGDSPTGSLVVLENGALSSSQYKRFKIKNGAKSDFEAICEVLMRRFKRDDWKLPDLIIIDGGKPQVRVVSQVL